MQEEAFEQLDTVLGASRSGMGFASASPRLSPYVAADRDRRGDDAEHDVWAGLAAAAPAASQDGQW